MCVFDMHSFTYFFELAEFVLAVFFDKLYRSPTSDFLWKLDSQYNICLNILVCKLENVSLVNTTQLWSCVDSLSPSPIEIHDKSI